MQANSSLGILSQGTEGSEVEVDGIGDDGEPTEEPSSSSTSKLDKLGLVVRDEFDAKGDCWIAAVSARPDGRYIGEIYFYNS